jgi:hypothetical protein
MAALTDFVDSIKFFIYKGLVDLTTFPSVNAQNISEKYELLD